MEKAVEYLFYEFMCSPERAQNAMPQLFGTMPQSVRNDIARKALKEERT